MGTLLEQKGPQVYSTEGGLVMLTLKPDWVIPGLGFGI